MKTNFVPRVVGNSFIAFVVSHSRFFIVPTISVEKYDDSVLIYEKGKSKATAISWVDDYKLQFRWLGFMLELTVFRKKYKPERI